MSHVVPLSKRTSKEAAAIWEEIYVDHLGHDLDQSIVDVVEACYRTLLSEIIFHQFDFNIGVFKSKIDHLDYATYISFLGGYCPIDAVNLEHMRRSNNPIIKSLRELELDIQIGTEEEMDEAIADSFGQYALTLIPPPARFERFERLIYDDIRESELMLEYYGSFLITVRPKFNRFVITKNVNMNE